MFSEDFRSGTDEVRGAIDPAKVKLRHQLDTIDGWLSEKGGDLLWDVLTALRGPDAGTYNYELKDRTTIHIRRAAFPRTADGYVKLGTATQRAQFDTLRSFKRPGLNDELTHFQQHIGAAARALGL